MVSLNTKVREDLVGLRVGNYLLERVLGRGRMGVVYLARDTALLRATAVKVLSWDFEHTFGANPTAWFLDEARHVAQINHPRVVQIYAAARQQDNCYIAMEFVNGPSAEALVEREGPLPVERATRIVVEVATALQAAHDAGVIHRDVKPANILVSEVNEWAKLGDFGMSLSNRSLQAGRGRVQAGTPYYTAPELWQGALASTSSDIYALGATYYYLLTGKPPFPSTSTSALRRMHLVEKPPDPRQQQPHLPPQVAQVIGKAMAKKPCGRFESASAFCQQAIALLPQLGVAYTVSVCELNSRRSEPPGVRNFPAPVGPFLKEFQFARRPFSATDPPQPTADTHPWVSTLSGLEAHLLRGSATLGLLGRSGTGRSTLLETLAQRLRATRNVLLVRQPSNAKSGQLIQGLGVASGNPHAPLRSIVDRLCEPMDTTTQAQCLPVVVVDQLSLGTMEDLARLEELRRSKRTFSLVVCADLSLEHKTSPILTEQFFLRSLTRTECTQHIQEWMQLTRAGTAPPLLFSPDSLLVLAARSEGVMSQLNRLALNALAIIAGQKRRVVTSFEALHASAEEDWVRQDATIASGLPTRPNSWPTPKALEELKALKARRSFPPEKLQRPRNF